MSANDDQNPVALVRRWRACIDTQMHFNDMLLRTRSTGTSIVLAVVEQTEELEASSRRAGQPLELFLTGCVSRRVSRARAAFVMWVFYGVPFLIGSIFMVYLAAIPAHAS